MTWRYVAHLVVFLSTINLSKEGCYDYFKIQTMPEFLTDNVPLVRTKDPKHIMECTIERECLQNKGGICDWLQCFDREEKVNATSEKCEGEIFEEVSFYHFMCMAAKALNHTPKGCEYDTVCKLFSEIASTVFDQTTALPPTTLPETTTGTTTTTALPPPPTTTTAALPTTTTTTAALPPSATALTSTPTVTQSAGSGSIGQHSEIKDETDTLTLRMLLMTSVFFHFIVPLAVYLYMRYQWKQDRRQWIVTHLSNGNSPGAAELKSETLLASATGEVESTH